jgi:hypothetical protein
LRFRAVLSQVLQLLPYNAKLCLNGHEYAKSQLSRQAIANQALDNGVLSCADPAALQRICNELSAEKIDRSLRPGCAACCTHYHRQSTGRLSCDISILQAKFSLTRVFDRPVHGRVFFEQVARENLDLGRPEWRSGPRKKDQERRRSRVDAGLKAKVASEALRKETIAELAAKSAAAEPDLRLEEAVGRRRGRGFRQRGAGKESNREAGVNELYTKIVQLTVERDFLSRRSRR